MTPTGRIMQPDNWGALRTLSVYRWTIAALLIGLLFADDAQKIVPGIIAEWLPALSGAYLIGCLLLSLALLFRWPGYQWQIYTHAAIDIGLTTGLIIVSGGLGSGLGVLMLTPVGGLSTLVPGRRMAALLAAIASLAILGQEIFRIAYDLNPAADYTMAGLLGGLLFIVSLTANTLAQRARLSAELAEQRGIDLANLANLNERIIHHMAVGAIVLDEEDNIRMLNQTAARMLNTRTRSMTRRPLNRIAPELAARVKAWRQRPETTLDGEVIEIGSQRILPHFSRLSHARGPMLLFLEDARRLGEHAQQIKLAALGRLTASIAHEIRNPLSAISHASQLIQDWENTPDEEARLLDIIDRHSTRINRIVESILSLSRREQTVPQVLHLRDFLEQLAAEYAHMQEYAGCNLDLSEVSAEIQVRFDPTHLRQILNNLWENTSRHAANEANQSVIIMRSGMNREGNRAYLDIRDDGPGIPEAIREQVFEPFFTSMHDGTGLGLYIARELCECNDAQLRLVQQPAPGACFRILFASNLEWAA